MSRSLATKAYVPSILIFMIFFTSLCQGGGIPHWYLNSTPDDDFTIYGAGEGNSLEEAKHAALRDISEKISVEIESRTDKKEFLRVDENASYSKSVNNQMSARTKQINFSNHEVTRAQEENGRYYVLLSIDKDQMIKDLISEMDFYFSDIRIEYESVQSQNVLTRLNYLRSITGKRTDILDKLKIINSMDPRMDTSSFYSELSFYKSELNKLQEKLSIILDLKDVSEIFRSVIAEHITTKGIVLKNNYNAQDSETITLMVSSAVKKMNIYSSFIVKMQLEFKFYSNDNNLIGNKKFEIKGASAIDYENAMSSAGSRLTEILEKEDIFKQVGLL